MRNRRCPVPVVSECTGRPGRVAAALAGIVLVFLASGCGSQGISSEPDRLTPQLLLDLDPEELEVNPVDGDADGVPVGIFLSTRVFSGERPWSPAQAAGIVRRLAEVLRQCGLSTIIETAQVIAVPADLLRLQGNNPGSFGGHPPPDADDPRVFNYEENERLTDEVRTLFAYGKQHTAPNTIAVFTVERIVYWIGAERVAAGGLSFPPNLYHHVDDYPLRNSVVLQAQHPAGGGLPTGIGPGTLAHELMHMLLNTGLHTADRENLLSEAGGRDLTPAQCAEARENRTLLFGTEAVPDPGPPSGAN